MLHLSQMIAILAISIEEWLTSHQLKRHAGQAPNVCGWAESRAYDGFRGSVRGCLNYHGEVMIDPTSVAQVC